MKTHVSLLTLIVAVAIIVSTVSSASLSNTREANPMLVVEYDTSVNVADSFVYQPTPQKGEHPRVYMHADDIPDLVARANSGAAGLGAAEFHYRLIRNNAVNPNVNDGHLNPRGGSPSNYYSNNVNNVGVGDILDNAFARAMFYAMKFDTTGTYNNVSYNVTWGEHGAAAKQIMLDFLETFDMSSNYRDYSSGNEASQILLNLCPVYDYVYDLLSEDDKWFCIDRFEYLLAHLEFSNGNISAEYPHGDWMGNFTQNSMNGHHLENPLAGMTALAIAVYDETEKYWDIISEYMYNHVFPTQQFLMNQGRAWQGTSYGPSRLIHIADCNLLFYHMQPADERQSFIGPEAVDVLLSQRYYRRPDGQLVRLGDFFVSSVPYNGWQMHGEASAALYLNSIYKDPYLQNMYDEFYTERRQSFGKVFMFDHWTNPKSPAGNLPLTYYSPYPNGEMICLTGWLPSKTIDVDSNIMQVDMRIGAVQSTNHEHLDAGSFQIYYKGGLAVDAGIYESANVWYSSPHDINWNKSTISHNSLLIRDPDYGTKYGNKPHSWNNPDPNQFIWRENRLENSGGQLFNFGSGRAVNSPDDIYRDADGVVRYYKSSYADGIPIESDDSQWKTAKILSAGMEPDTLTPEYSYLKGDLAELYGYRADEVNRSFMFLNFKDNTYPGALIVFDKITTNTQYSDYLDYEKYWLLHSIEEPEINPETHEVTIKNTKPFGTTGKNYNGQLVSTPLLPVKEDLKTDLVYDYNVFGKVFEGEPNKPTEEAGKWMIMQSPVSKAQTHLMLNVLQCEDAGKTPLPVTLVGNEADQMAGAKINGCVTMFSTDGNLNDDLVVIPTAGNEAQLKYYVADLAGGAWNVFDSKNEKITEFSVEEEGNIGVFSAPASDVYRLVHESFDPGKMTNGFTPVKGTHYTLSDADGQNGWFKSGTFTITPANGYQISTNNTDAGPWQTNTLEYTTETDNTDVSFYLRNTATKEISVMKTERYKKDSTAPTGEIKIKNGSWKSFLNQITFGLFFKDKVDVTITGADTGSDVAAIEYIKSESGLPVNTDWDALTWTSYSPFNVAANWKGIIYARITDNAGNTVVISSDGLVVYTNAAANVNGGSFSKNSADDLTVAVSMNGNTVKTITRGGVALTAGTDYTVSTDSIVLKNSYLKNLANGMAEFTINYSPLGEIGTPDAMSDALTATIVTVNILPGATEKPEPTKKPESTETPLKVPDFTDLKRDAQEGEPGHHWALEWIFELADKGVINGYDDGSFKPEGTISRAEYVQMLTKAFGIYNQDAKCPEFTDVKEDDWFRAAVASAKIKNITAGKTADTFEPAAKMSRQEMMTLTARALKELKGYEFPNASEIDELLKKFADKDEIAAFKDFKESIALNIKLEIVGGSKLDSGDWMLYPGADIKRGEVAKILSIAIKK